MAIVSEKNKFIFFHLYKCGGMSMREFISPIDDLKEVLGSHCLPSDVKEHFKQNESLKKFSDMFKFTFVRNPFDFMVSTYFYAKRYSDHFMYKDIIENDMDLIKFIHYYFETREKHKNENLFGANRVVTFKDWLLDKDGYGIMDFVGRLENLHNDLSFIMGELNFPITNVIPNVNVNSHRKSDYRIYYNDESRKLIESNFEWELNLFGYDF